MEINEEYVEKLYEECNCFSQNLRIETISYHHNDHCDEIRILSGNHKFIFLCNGIKFKVCNLDHNGLIKSNYCGTFDYWRSVINSITIPGNPMITESLDLLSKLRLGNAYFSVIFSKFLEKMFSIIEAQSELNILKKGVNLISLSKDLQIRHIKKQDWYNKLLEEYTEYYQSGSKSDIAERHYQEQARLHGLKFVIR